MSAGYFLGGFLLLCGFAAGVLVMCVHARLQARLVGKPLPPALLPRELREELPSEAAKRVIRRFEREQHERWAERDRRLAAVSEYAPKRSARERLFREVEGQTHSPTSSRLPPADWGK